METNKSHEKLIDSIISKWFYRWKIIDEKWTLTWETENDILSNQKKRRTFIYYWIVAYYFFPNYNQSVLVRKQKCIIIKFMCLKFLNLSNYRVKWQI